MKSVFDRQQQRVVREGGELQLDHEQLVRSALLEAEGENALVMADLLAISRASIDGFNQAVATEIHNQATEMERTDLEEFNRAVAEQILDRTTLPDDIRAMERASQAEFEQAANVEIFDPATDRAGSIARVVTKTEVTLAA